MKKIKCDECECIVKVPDDWDEKKDVLDCPGCLADYENYLYTRD